MKVACAERRTDDCAARAQNILAQDPVNYDALFLTGALSLEKGEALQAARTFNQLANIYVRDAKAKYQLAVAYFLAAKNAGLSERRELEQAAEGNLNLAFQLDPSFAPAVMLLAELKIRKGVAAAAEDMLGPLIKANPKLAQAQYLLASAYIAQRKTDQALAVYRQMSELFPQDPKPSLEAGKILVALGRPTEAREAFEKSVSIAPDFVPGVEALVDSDLAGKQYGPALARVQPLIDKDPKNALAWAVRGKIYLAQQDVQHAEQDLKKAIDLDAKLEPATLLLAQLYLSTNRTEQAIETLNAYVATNKTLPALMQLAGIHERLKQFDKSRDAYEQVLKVSPDFAPALNNLAVLYSDYLGQNDRALELAQKAKELIPNDPSTADTLGWILFKKADYLNALRQLQDSAAKMADNPEVQFHLGMTRYMMGAEGPAREALQKAANSDKDSPQKTEARQRLEFLSRTGSDDEAKLQDYLRDRPNDPLAMTRLAQLQAKNGAPDQAVKTLEKITENNPSFTPATRELALLYVKQPPGDSKFFNVVTKARQAYPDDSEITKTLGILNYRRDAYPQAVELLKQAAAQRKDDPELLYYLGSGYRQLKQWNDCKDTLQRAVSLNPPAAIADQANRELADCAESSP